jgi:hypothetical protein
MSDLPIVWRCSWLLLTNNPPFHGKPAHQNYPTRDLAEQKRQALCANFGERVVASVTPVYLSRRARKAKLFRAQDSRP